MTRKSLLEYANSLNIFPASLSPAVCKAATLLFNYRERCRDVVIITTAELIRRQAAQYQIQAVDDKAFPAVFSKYRDYINERKKFLESSEALWDSQGKPQK